MINFAKILKVVQKLTPKDLKIPPKFSLDEETNKLQEEIYAKKKYDVNYENIYNIKNKIQINYLTTSIKKIKQLESIKIPYEKMMKIASISSTITKSINNYWKGIEKYINPYFFKYNGR